MALPIRSAIFLIERLQYSSAIHIHQEKEFWFCQGAVANMATARLNNASANISKPDLIPLPNTKLAKLV
jgi:hypothetical protein